MTSPTKFFDYARERHAVHLRRAAGLPRPWTDDPILQSHRFCNVYRELDRTTAWFRQHVRDPMRDQPEVLLATVVFRWFNRITTGEAIFCQTDIEAPSAFDLFLRTGRTDHLRKAIVALSPKGPYVTGSYTINTRSAGLGLSKLDGVLKLIQMWIEGHSDWRIYADRLLAGGPAGDSQLRDLEGFCQWATGPCLGPFMTYEIACDLRYTALLERAPDRLTWANLGPGAKRGLNRIFLPNGPIETAISEVQALKWMGDLLELSRKLKYWPQADGQAASINYARDWDPDGPLMSEGAWPAWEMREVEHTLCEFDKYERVRLGQGRPRGSFNGR